MAEDDAPRSPLLLPWRTGRHVGRTIYVQLGPEPSDEDPFIGCLDSAELAAEACEAHNERLLHAEIREGLNAAERGETVDLGSFAQYGSEDEGAPAQP